MIAAVVDRIWRVVPRRLRDFVVPTGSALRGIGRRWRHSALPPPRASGTRRWRDQQ